MRIVFDALARSGRHRLSATTWRRTGPRLAAMRRLAKWSQKDLARRAGVHVQTVKYWERQPGPIAGHAPKRFLEQFAAKRVTVESVSRHEPGYVDPNAPDSCGAKTRKGKPCKTCAPRLELARKLKRRCYCAQ
jgi:DNA-binding XRE family transcriptional regulator